MRWSFLLVLASCGTEFVPPSPIQPGPSPLRRLTNDDYNNTVADLLGDTSAPATSFPGATTSTQGFDTFATGLGVSVTHMRSYLTAAENLATTAVRNDLAALLDGCDATADEVGCVRGFVIRFGERAFRRPLSDAEVTRFVELQVASRTNHDFAGSIRVTLEAFLLSPAFLYRIEVGELGEAGEPVRLTSYEMASRLSYLFSSSMPDAELFRAARDGELDDPAQIEEQARRLLAAPRARDVFTHFVDQWLELRGIESMQKTAGVFPDYDDSLRPLMKQEANRLVDSIVWDGDGDAFRLFTADYSFVNGPLAKFYGIPGVTGDAFQRVSLDPAQRKGLLTMAGVLASHGKPNQTLPARRGKFISTKLFCNPVGVPPPDAIAMAPVRTADMTNREYFTLIDQQPACGACHVPLDNIGYALENFDGVGRWRTTEMGKPIDSSGELVDTDVDGPFSSGVELADRIADSKLVAACISSQMFQFAAGRQDSDEDSRSLSQLGERFTSSNHSLRELMVALTQTDAFQFLYSQGAAR